MTNVLITLTDCERSVEVNSVVQEYHHLMQVSIIVRQRGSVTSPCRWPSPTSPAPGWRRMASSSPWCPLARRLSSSWQTSGDLSYHLQWCRGPLAPVCRQADTLPSWLSFTVLLDSSAAALEQQLYSVLGRGDNTSLALLTLDSG